MRQRKLAAKLAVLHEERQNIRSKVHRSEWAEAAFEQQEAAYQAAGRAIALIVNGRKDGLEEELRAASVIEPWKSFVGRLRKLVRKLNRATSGKAPVYHPSRRR